MWPSATFLVSHLWFPPKSKSSSQLVNERAINEIKYGVPLAVNRSKFFVVASDFSQVIVPRLVDSFGAVANAWSSELTGTRLASSHTNSDFKHIVVGKLADAEEAPTIAIAATAASAARLNILMSLTSISPLTGGFPPD